MDERTSPLLWRPRMRLVWLWTRGIAVLDGTVARSNAWVGRRFPRGAGRALAFGAYLVLAPLGYVLGVAVVGEVTIIPLAVSIYLVAGEWLLLGLLAPVALLLRLSGRLRPV